MKIAIVGAGVIGVTTAHELAADGHEVTVFERHAAVAEEASFANGGVVGPGYLALAGPPAGLRTEGGRPATLPWPPSRAGLRWRSAARRANAPERWADSRRRLLALANYSRERLHALSLDLQLEYDCAPGCLVLWRTDKDRAAHQETLAFLQEAGVRHEELSPEGVRALEPGLNPETPLAGALHLPDDGVANCRQFTLLLRRAAQALGAHFAFRCEVAPLDRSAPTLLRVTQADGSTESLRFDAVVLCVGAGSAALLRPLGLPPAVPLMAAQRHSIRAPLGEPLNAPESAVIDAQRQVSISRLGQRLRVAGGAALDSTAGRRDPEAIAGLYGVLQDWFPAGALLSGRCATVQEWSGTRAVLPDGPPVLGASGVPGIWLNLGHGDHGWGLACGSARVVADQLASRPPAIDTDGLGITRLLDA